MNNTIKASNFLAHTDHEFDHFHIQSAKKINGYIHRQQWKEIGTLLKGLSENDKERIHYAFFDLFGYDYEIMIHREVGNVSDLRRIGLL